MTEAGDRLALIVSVAVEMLATGSVAGLAPLLDENVFWQGPRPDLSCSTRSEVLGILGRGVGRRPLRVTRLEAQEVGDHVVVSVDGPDLPETPALASGASRSLVFTFRGEVVVRIESVADRDAAFRLVGS
ncbi:MAG: hypothetical protein ACREQM_08225 [Candidatus Dormibacteraceae bacterium]